MYVTLFNLAGYAIVAWLLLIFLPRWGVTRFVARTAIFPVYLSVLYVVGVAAVLAELGPGLMRDFGSAEGVTRILARQDVALVAWIHILAFDQLVALHIYRENMDHHHVPLPVQSVLLVLTLMFGPAGFLAYYLLRLASRSRGASRVGEGEAAPTNGKQHDPRRAETTARVSVTGRRLLSVFGEERALFRTALAGIVLGTLLFVYIAVNGRAVPPEGDLFKAATFDIAVGIYVLTVTLLLPFAGFSPRGRAVWRWLTVAFVTYGYALETAQMLRGLDPRFTRAGGPADQLLGGVFFLVAMGLAVLFVVLALRFFSSRTAVGGTLFLLGVRYACAAALFAHGVGLWMSLNQGPRIGAGGNLLPLHAAGFHGLQAVPLVALLFAWSQTPTEAARRWVHAAGLAWLGACVGIAWQTGAGRSVSEPAAGGALALALFAVWALSLARAAFAWGRAGFHDYTERAGAAA